MPQINQPLPSQNQYGLPPRVNQVRTQFGFGSFSPINTESEDNCEEKEEEREDLAATLLNSFEVPKTTPAQLPAQPQEKTQFPAYYPSYPAYQPQSRAMSADARWVNYPQISQQQQNVYNPMSGGKFQSGVSSALPVMQGGMQGGPSSSVLKSGGSVVGGQQQYYDPRYPGYPPQPQ